MLVSIVMPVKNTEPYLRECLDSILAQSHTEWELLAVDDGSSDDSLALLRSYSQKDSRIKALRNTGGGIIPALQTGYAVSSGTFITRMDSDDIMMPSKLELMIKCLEKGGKKTVTVGLVDYFSEGALGDGYRRYAEWLNALTLAESHFNDIYKECVIPSPCWMMYKEDFDRIGGFTPDIYPEDYDLCFRMYKNGIRTLGVPQILHRWRDRSDRTSRTHEHYADNRFFELKVRYFLEIDHDTEASLFLWGAGKKGKRIARLLLECGVSFRWVCDNEKKIGKEIYGVVLEGIRQVGRPDGEVVGITGKGDQVIIAVSSPDAQAEIIRSKDLIMGVNSLKTSSPSVRSSDLTITTQYFWFC